MLLNQQAFLLVMSLGKAKMRGANTMYRIFFLSIDESPFLFGVSAIFFHMFEGPAGGMVLWLFFQVAWPGLSAFLTY